MLTTIPFGSSSKFIKLESLNVRGTIEVFFKDSIGGYNLEPFHLLPSEEEDFSFVTDEIKVFSEVKSNLELIVIFGTTQIATDVLVPFTKDTLSPLFLKSLSIGDKIKRITVRVTEAFDPGWSMTIGFPSDNDELVQASKIKPQKVEIFGYNIFRESIIAETLNAYFSGSSTTGKGFICVE